MGAVENGDLASVNLDFSNSVKSIYSEMIAYADAVVFYTDQDLEFAKGRYPARVREKLLRIQPALDIGVEKAKTREKLEKAIFVGTPRHLRNAVTIEMIKNVIAPRVPGVVFIIAGPDLAECRQGNVVCLDFRDDTRQLIKDSDVYVAPVMSGAGISTKFLDPISLGIPIITTPKGAEGYPAVHMKDMIIEPDPAGFPYWINELNSKESRARLAANASTGMEAYFSPEAVGRKWDELISKLLDMR
jgi:glycosyltransferase involved in cell wall biosynthesis